MPHAVDRRPEDGQLVFVYGTLMLAVVRHRVTGRDFEHGPAAVEGYERRRVRGETYPVLVPEPGARTDGLLLRGVRDADLRALDAFEGAMYARRQVPVEVGDGPPTPAWVWLLAPGHEARVDDAPWELDRFAAQDLATFLAQYEGFDA